MRHPSASWSASARRGELPRKDGRGTGSRPDDDGRTRSTETAPATAPPQGLARAGGRDIPAPQPSREPLPASPRAGAGAALERRGATTAAVEPSTVPDAAHGPTEPTLTSLPENCRREILRALVQAAGRRQIPAADTVATATDRIDPDQAWHAHAIAIAGRTCRYVAALQASPDDWPADRIRSAERLARFCGSCSSEAPTVEVPIVLPESVVVLHREPLPPSTGRRPLPGHSSPVGPRRRARATARWALALSASALIGGTAALVHHSPAGDGRPRPRATVAADATPGTPTTSSPPATRGSEGAGGSFAGAVTPLPAATGTASSLRPPDSGAPGQSSAAQLPTAPGAPTAAGAQPPRQGPALEPTPRGSAEAPVTVRTSPAPSPAGTRRPSPAPPTGRPSSPVPGASTEPPVVVGPSPSPSGFATPSVSGPSADGQ